MTFSNHLENLALDCIFGKIMYIPNTLWLGLSTTDPLDNGLGINEPWSTGVTAPIVPEGGGWLWLRGGSWDYLPEGYPAEDTGGWLYSKMFPDDPDPPESGGFPDLPSGSEFQLLSKESGYKRVETVPANWSYASAGSVVNIMPLTFPTALSNWGVLNYFALFDAWYLIMSGILSTPKTINVGQTARFGINELTVLVD